MLDLNLFRNASFTSANAVMLLIGLAMFGMFFFVSLYVQNILGYSPLQAGATFLPMTLLIILVAPNAGRLVGQARPAGDDGAGRGALTRVAPPLLAPGRELDLLDAPAGAARRRLRHGDGDGADDVRRDARGAVDKAGVGSAVINSMRQVGGAVGLAMLGAIVATQVDPRSRTRRTSSTASSSACASPPESRSSACLSQRSDPPGAAAARRPEATARDRSRVSALAGSQASLANARAQVSVLGRE